MVVAGATTAGTRTLETTPFQRTDGPNRLTCYGISSPDPTKIPLEMTDLRTQLYAAVMEMERRGLVAGSSGNASVRLAPVDTGERYLITPAGLPYEHMKPADLVEVDENIEPVTGDGIPSTESALHLGIYHRRPDVGAVVHTHSLYASVSAVVGKPIPPIVDEMVVYLGGPVEVAEYGFPGTEELAEAVAEALGDRRAVLLRNHGMCTVGVTAEEALRNAVLVERIAQIYAFAQIAGGAKNVPEDAVEAERAVYMMRYGLSDD